MPVFRPRATARQRTFRPIGREDDFTTERRGKGTKGMGEGEKGRWDDGTTERLNDGMMVLKVGRRDEGTT